MNIIKDWGKSYENISEDGHTFCVVMNGDAVIRSIFRVANDAMQRFEELKSEYYSLCQKVSGEVFLLFSGMDQVKEFQESW